MVDVVRVAYAPRDVHIVVDGGEDILLRDVLRDQLVDVSADRSLELLLRSVVEDLAECRIVHEFGDAELFLIAVDIVRDLNHKVRENLAAVLLALLLNDLLRDNIDVRDRRVLDLVREGLRDQRTLRSENLAGGHIRHVLGEVFADNAVAKHQLLVEFITADLCEIVSLRVEEHAVKERFRTLHRERLARTQLLIQFKETVLIIVGRILLKGSLKNLLIAEHLVDLGVGAHTEGTQKYRDRNLAVAVNANIEHIVCVGLVLKPCAAVRDHRRGVQLLTELIMCHCIIYTGGTDQLADDNTLGTVDHEGTVVRHQGEVAHEHDMFLDLARLRVVKTNLDLQRRCVGRVALLALVDRILGIVPAELIIHKLQAESPVMVGYRRDVGKHLIDSFLKEPPVRVLLHFDQVRHLKDVLFLREAHANVLADLHRMNSVFIH